MRKLTAEQISRVLSHEAVGLLTHETFARESDGCGCVAGAALVIQYGEEFYIPIDSYRLVRMDEVSAAVRPLSLCGGPYLAKGPDEILRMLEKAGLA